MFRPRVLVPLVVTAIAGGRAHRADGGQPDTPRVAAELTGRRPASARPRVVRLAPAILHMKPLLAAQARRSGAAFFAAVVSLDWELKSAMAFVASLAAFDEYLLGANWVGAGAQHDLWADSTATPGLPQVVVLERTIRTGTQGITFGPERVLRRVIGDAPIVQWVRAGAPIGQ